MESDKKIFIYDTTLRDGRQAEKVNFSVIDMLKVAEKLDWLGVDYIEGGWPGSNPKDMFFFKEVKKLNLKHSKIAAFGSTRHAKKKVDEDSQVQALIDSEAPVITIFGKSWKLHVTDVFRISLEENLNMIYETVAYLKDNGREVIFDAEHFFDGFFDDPDYALNAVRAAEKGGADNITLADTNGGRLPWEISEAINAVKEVISTPLGIHTHNDSELAVANTITAVREGVILVQGTINGYGERCGNANLSSIIPILVLKMNLPLAGIDRENLKKLTFVSRFVDEMANLKSNHRLPFVGASAFAHKGGVHVNAVRKNPKTYEHIDPESVGNERRILISELSGKSNVIQKLDDVGIRIEDTSLLNRILQKLKELENEGFVFEGAEASFELLVREEMGQMKSFFDFNGFRVITEKPEKGMTYNEATVKITIDGEKEFTVDEGDGPVNALDKAFKKALVKFFPQVKELKLVDYKVRIVNPKEGTAAKIRVLIESRYRDHSWTTIGVSENIVEASWQALVDSVRYLLFHFGGQSE